MITIPAIANRTYALLGLGKTGVATAQALLASGARVLAWDDGEAARQAAAGQNIELVDLAQKDFSQFDALVMSPGIPHTYPTPHPVAAKAKAANVPIIGDIELLFRACPDATYIGITGTNGKSTTTSLIAHILNSAGRTVEVGGNLGMPVLSFAPLGKDGIYVLELSSYQLELITQNRLKIAILLNITPDHLGRHGGMAGYIAAKARIVAESATQTLIVGVEEKACAMLADEATQKPHMTVRRVAVHEGGKADITAPNLMLTDGVERILDLRTLPALPGRHNAQNIAVAWAACRALGLSREDIVAGLRSFPGLAHRQQLVATHKGVRYINDSKATNADATEKALVCYDNIYWILGGRPKEGGLNGLEPHMCRIRHAFLIGEATEEFARWFDGKASYTKCGTLDKAVRQAAAMAENDGAKNPVVLLSPACASWDQFASFEQRGEVFAACVGNLVRQTA